MEPLDTGQLVDKLGSWIWPSLYCSQTTQTIETFQMPEFPYMGDSVTLPLNSLRDI